jgi:hypothetical protein
MEYKYKLLLKEHKLTLESDVLDPAFVQKAKDFEEALKKKELTEDQINAIDDELVELFSHLEIEEVDSPELAKEKHKAKVLEAKNVIAAAETLDELKKLQKEYEALPELQPFIEKRIEKLEKAVEEATDKAEKEKFITDSTAEIAAAKYETLAGLSEKFKDHPDLVKLIEARIIKEKPAAKEMTIREKLQAAKKRRWTYDDLIAIGIKPTGDDMKIEGVYLQREYMFKVYFITEIDGVKV